MVAELSENIVVRDPMKFLNGDDSLNDIMDQLRSEGSRITLPNADMLMQAILDTTWE